MKPLKTKAQIREELDSQMNAFLKCGGAVESCQAGESGRKLNAPLPKSPHVEGSKQSRTPVLSEIKAIESRRQQPKRVAAQRQRRHGEKKILLTDDFGEPLRWVSD